MDRSLKLLHLVGMALFLGSIAVYIALSPWTKTGGLVLMALTAAAVGVWNCDGPAIGQRDVCEARRGSPDQDIGRRLLGGMRNELMPRGSR